MLKELLDSKHCFKLVCGAGNEDVEDVRRLVHIYASAGCRFFDLSANEQVIDAARQVLEAAGIYDAYLCVSVGIKDDPHVNKAVIDYNRCVNCGCCEEACLEGAIVHGEIKKSKCTGCERCYRVCPRGAVSYVSEEKSLTEVLPPIVDKGIECIEFHATGRDEEEIFSKWKYINDNYDGLLSICISRGKLGDERLVERIKKMIENRKAYTTIVQADGFPMSGGDDDYKTTLQAVATAEIIQKANLPVYLILSGGTNKKTSELAKMCDIDYHGIAVGSYARKIVRNFLNNPDFWENQSIINDAVEAAKPLVNSVLL